MNKRRLLLAGLFLLTAAFLPAFGRKEKPNLVQAEGLVRLVGNEPFTEIVISGSEKTWYIARDEQYKLMDLQHRTVTVEGEESEIEMKFASGMSAGKRFQLNNVRIIAVRKEE